jgi:hypothetical protein
MRVEYFYDRQTRCWWVRTVDANGNQVGDAEHTYTKAEALNLTAERMANLDAEAIA